jgi:hypothetical protein
MPAQTTDLFLLEDLEDVGRTSQLPEAIYRRFAPSQTGSRLSWSGLMRILAALAPSVPSCLSPWNSRRFGSLQSRSPTATCHM